MRNPGSPALTDWIVITIRWAFLVILNLWLAMGIGFTSPVVLVLLIQALANIAASVGVIYNRNSRPFRVASVVVDLLFAHLLYFLTGALEGKVGWAGLLPLITGALYLRWIGATMVILINVAVQLWVAQIYSPFQDALLQVATLLFIYLPVGLPLAYLSQRWSNTLAKQRFPARVIDSRERAHRRTIYDLLAALSESLNYQRVLETSLDLSAEALIEINAPAETLISAVLLFAEAADSKATALQIATSRGLLPADLQVVLPGTQGVIGKAIDEGSSSFTRTASSDPELKQLTTIAKTQSAYVLPLRTGMDAYGALLFAHPEVDFFTRERREILDIVGHQSVIAIQNARLYQDLEQEKERMMEIQDEGRKKMARDLHDGPTQSVSAIAMRVNFARRLMDRDPKAAAEELFKIEELARRTTKEIRHMLFTLRPLVLESQGLVAALESMAEKMGETYGQNVIIQADNRVVEQLELGKQSVVFYIAEEAVNNARKHARADHIWVRLKLLKDNLGLLEIEDDGVGFNVNAVDAAYDNRGSLGLVNMRERSELINGILRVDSAEGRGTRVQIVIPLTEEAADRLRRSV